MNTAVKIKPQPADSPPPLQLCTPPGRQPVIRRSLPTGPRTLADGLPAGWLPALQPAGAAAAPARADAAGFAALLQAYRSTGGIAHGELLARQAEAQQHGAMAALARLIIAGHLLAFEWRHAWWVPLFQLQPAGLVVQPACQPVQAELARCGSRWSAAIWWAKPNAQLDGWRPLDVVQTDPAAVLSAARLHARPTPLTAPRSRP